MSIKCKICKQAFMCTQVISAACVASLRLRHADVMLDLRLSAVISNL